MITAWEEWGNEMEGRASLQRKMAGSPRSESREEGRFLPKNLEIYAILVKVLEVLFRRRTQNGPYKYVSVANHCHQDDPGRPMEFLAS